MERLASHFTNALHSLPNRIETPPHHPCESLQAFQLMQNMSPCVKFGHFTANQAILEAVAGERRVHVVDFDVAEGVQWASLMQALVSVSPPPQLRITALARIGRSVQETGRRLAGFAASVGLPFSFGQCKVDEDERFRPARVKSARGEAVVFNCVMRWGSAAGAVSFVAGATAVGARVVTVVEEEREGVGFGERFMAEFVRYSAIWDALEAGFGEQGRAREMVERIVLGPMIEAAVGRAYEGMGFLDLACFGKVELSFFNVCQARFLLGLFNEGYGLEEDGGNKLVLCWKSCRLVSASVWSAPPPETFGA